MYNTVILPLAKKDIQEAARWYNNQQEGLGKRFTAEVRKNVRFIKQNPQASNVRYKNVRTTVLNIFPYMIHYTIDENIKTIIISAVLHASRNPKFWNSRG